MCRKCDALELDVTAEVMLAAAERELILTQADNGESVPHAIRPLSKAERAAKMRFSEIEALQQSAAEEAAKLLASNAQVYISSVIGAIFGAADAVQPAAVVDAIESLNRVQPDDVIAETAAAQKAMSDILRDVYTGASEVVIGEAQRQGVKKTPKPLTAAPDRFDLLAQAVAMHPWTRLTSKLQADMMTPANLAKPAIEKTDVQASLEQIPLDGAVDLAKQTIHSAHGAGRVDAAATMPPEDIVASELLDGATCDACARVDGKEYKSLADATTEYETGGYGACKGGGRCRGTLVFLYNSLGTDAPPVVPGPAPIPVLVKPKTPRKKPTPQPAPVVPDVIKTPPDAPLTRRQLRDLERQQAEQAKKDNPRSLPPEPTGTPPKRRKGQVQRYDALDQLPVKHANADKKPETIAAFTNPGYAASNGLDKNYSNNCSSVVQAYEFQRRGYDVRAAPVKAGRGRYDDEYMGQWWEDADGRPVEPIYVTQKLGNADTDFTRGGIQKRQIAAKQALDAYIIDQPDGARGFIALHWAKGGGHVFSWEKVDGKPVYLEAQTGITDGERHLAPGKFKPDSLRVVRIDDKTPTNAVTEALETRPDTLAEELAGKAPTVAQMKAQSQHRIRTHPDGTREIILAKYRVNPFTRKWEEIPADVLAQIRAELEKMEAKRKK